MPRPARVLFVTHNAPRFLGDAAGSFVLRLAVALQETGTRVHIIAPGASGLSDHDTIEGVSIERVRYASEARMTLAYTGTMAEAVMGSWSGRLAFIGLLRAFRRRVDERVREAAAAGDPFTSIHAHWWFPSGLALWKARTIREVPLVITMHGSDVRLAARKPLAHPLMRAVLGEAKVCTAVSTWLAETVQRIAPGAAVEVAPMPVDTRHFAAPPTVTRRSGLLFVGRLNAQKGLADLLEALAAPVLAGVTLDIVGDGPDRARFAAQVDRLHLASRVRWHGALPQADLVPLYATAQAVVVPSRGEGLGLVAVEAQLCGTPVIAYADAGLLDVVRPEHGGTLVPVGDVARLTAAIDHLVHAEENAARLGAAGRADMLARFTPAAVAARYTALYSAAESAP